MKQPIMKNKIKALGFIEVLIAIVVVGIVSAVFLSIAGRAMKDLIQAERVEYMSRIAKDAMNIAQEVANQEREDLLVDNNLFPDETTDINECFFPKREVIGDEVTYKFAKNESDIFESRSASVDRDQLVGEIKNDSNLRWFTTNDGIDWNDNYFVLMCIRNIDTSSRWANVEFWVGDLSVKGERTDSTDVKDFRYYAIIEL
jgi:type II secretory pathway pseudopilin PulG